MADEFDEVDGSGPVHSVPVAEGDGGDVPGGTGAAPPAPSPDPRETELADFDSKWAGKTFDLGPTIEASEAVKVMAGDPAGKVLLERWGPDAAENMGHAQGAAKRILENTWRSSPSAAKALREAVDDLSVGRQAAILDALAGFNREATFGGAGDDVPGVRETAREKIDAELDSLYALMRTDMGRYKSAAVQKRIEALTDSKLGVARPVTVNR